MTEASEIAPIALFSVIIVIGILAFVIRFDNAVEEKVAQETTKLVAERTAANIKALHAFPRGTLEMDLRQPYKLSVSKREEVDEGGYDIYTVNATYLGVSGYANLSTSNEIVYDDPDSSLPDWFGNTAEEEANLPEVISPDTGYESVCLVKGQNKIYLRGGSC